MAEKKHETPHVGFLDTTKLPKTKGSMSCPKGLGVFQGKNSLETEKKISKNRPKGIKTHPKLEELKL